MCQNIRCDVFFTGFMGWELTVPILLRELRQLAEKLTDKNRAGTGQSSSERKKNLKCSCMRLNALQIEMKCSLCTWIKALTLKLHNIACDAEML